MKIFADYHHGDLYYSFHLLFEKRLGHTLFRPIGIDWFSEGYWKIGSPYPDPHDTAMQYLSTEGYTGTFPANAEYYVEDDIYYTYQPAQDFYHKAITFETFKKMDFDVIISSIPAHDKAYTKLLKKYQPCTKHICHVGNSGQTSSCENIMSSMHPFPVSSSQNVVFCRQEFDINIFKYIPFDYNSEEKRRVISILHYMQSLPLMREFGKKLSEHQFESYGCGMPLGDISIKRKMAQKMQEAFFGWFIRAPGFSDGYSGHTFLNWCASGRPLIVRLSDNKPYPPSPILKPDINCIDISNISIEEAIRKIREFSDPDKHRLICEEMFNAFKTNVNFDRDAEKVKAFLEVLK